MEYFLLVPLLYLYFRLDERSLSPATLRDRSFIPAAAAALGIGLVMAGVAHVAYPDFYAAILPWWLPEKIWFSWVGGWVRMAAGIALMQPQLRRTAQVTVLLMLMAQLPTSIQFAWHFDFTGGYFDFPWAWSRLICHVGWLGWTLWCILPAEQRSQQPATLRPTRATTTPYGSTWMV